MDNIAVVGIGNILLSDEGIGVRVVEGLQKFTCWPNNLKLIDGGTTGLDLVSALSGCQKLIVVDAVYGDQAPGSIYVFSNEQIKQYFHNRFSLHEIGIREVLLVLSELGRPVEEVIIIGVQPAVIEMGLELSQPVQGQLGNALGAVFQQLSNWGIQF